MQPFMKALYITEPRKISITTQPIPRPQADEVVVRVRCFGICGTDFHIYHGEHRRAVFPLIPGHEWSGEIVEIGQGVKGFSVGDHVVGETTIACGRCYHCLHGHYNLCLNGLENGIYKKDGAASQYMVFPVYGLHRVSESLSFEQACLIEPSAISYRAVELVNVTPADNVLVVGSGPIGLLAVKIAKIFGAKLVTLVGLREKQLEVGRQLGADRVINIAKEDYLESVQRITNNQFFNVAIEASGNSAAMEQIIDKLAPCGRICFLGAGRANIDVSTVVSKELQLYGSVSSPGVWDTVIDLFESGRMQVADIITHTFELEGFESALYLIESQDPSVIKTVIQM